jgi:Rieske 2Fe-2S family protein
MNTNRDPIRSAGGARGLAGQYVLSTEIYDRETERIFSRHWVCVARLEELDSESRCLPVAVENHRLFLIQDEAGSVRAFRNFCRHRGSQLVNEQNCATLGKRIQCPYHAWTYDRSGELVSAPNMEGVSDFQTSDHGLIEVACQTKGGFLWINFSPQQSLNQWLDPISDRFAAWRIGELRIAHEITYTVKANWKLIFQNYSECYHCPIVHPMLNRLTPYRGSSNDLDKGPILGGPMSLADDSLTMSNDGKLAGPPIRGLNQEQSRSVYYFTIFPTMFLSLHPDYVLIHRLQRMDAGNTKVVCQFLFQPESINVGGFDPSQAIDFWDLTNRQDWEVCELAQLGMSEPGYFPGPYSNLESVVAAFDRHYLETME